VRWNPDLLASSAKVTPDLCRSIICRTAEEVLPSDRRSHGLTRDRFVDFAIRFLDATGESGLTFGALTLRLEAGHGTT
jgi:hypothetical protein